MPQPNKRTPGAKDNSARVAKSIEASAAPATPVKRIPGERIAEPPLQTTREEEIDHVLALLAGQVGTDSETIQYFIDKARSLAEEGVALEKTLAQIQRETAAQKQRMSAIRFELESTKNDIANWLKRPDAKPPELKPVE